MLGLNFTWKKLSALGGVSFCQIYYQLHGGAITCREGITFVYYLLQ